MQLSMLVGAVLMLGTALFRRLNGDRTCDGSSAYIVSGMVIALVQVCVDEMSIKTSALQTTARPAISQVLRCFRSGKTWTSTKTTAHCRAQASLEKNCTLFDCLCPKKTNNKQSSTRPKQGTVGI